MFLQHLKQKSSVFFCLFLSLQWWSDQNQQLQRQNHDVNLKLLSWGTIKVSLTAHLHSFISQQLLHPCSGASSSQLCREGPFGPWEPFCRRGRCSEPGVEPAASKVTLPPEVPWNPDLRALLSTASWFKVLLGIKSSSEQLSGKPRG